METIKGILFEPVGCLAEFPSEPFLDIAALLSGRKKQTTKSGSRAYWHLLNVMEEPVPWPSNRASGNGSVTEPRASASDHLGLELKAVDGATMYEDVLPALAELQAMGIRRFIASSLSNAAITRFLEACPHDFDGVWNRDNAGGIKAAPLIRALQGACLRPEQTMFLTDTAEGLKIAENVGVNAILMMNDPDESRRLATHNPAGGIVSLHELPDFIRLLRAERGAGQH
jgi:FMN phosphatase YigB (HAD superfamily)